MIDTIAVVAFALAYLSLMTRWIMVLSPYWPLPLIASLLVALLANMVDVFGLVIPLLLLVLIYFKLQGKFQESKAGSIIDIIIALLCLVLAIHILPGFHNVMIVDNQVIKSHSTPYSLWFNYDKALAGIFLVICFINILHVQKSLISIFAWTGVGLGANFLLLFLPSINLGLIKLDTNIPDFIAVWLVSNLLITALAEEAFFRGFIQQRIELFFLSRNIAYASMFAVLISSILFGIAHFRGGIFFVLTGCLAGLVYGLVYVKTRRIEAAILTHYLTNTIHILFFSYPVLSQ